MRSAAGILLAAGQGQRFGSNKLLHPLANGVPLAVHAARTLQAVLPDTLVVVNAADQETIKLFENEGLQIVLNDQARRGMGTSIACGVRASVRSERWVIALADMPCISEETIRSVAAGIHYGNSICAPRYENQRGHPVGFGKAYADELIGLMTDEGARHIIAANRQHLVLVDTQDRGVIADIDHLHDLVTANAYV